MKSRWEVCNDLLEGRHAVFQKISEYLPQEIKETDKAYKARVRRSALHNIYKRAIQTLVGYTFQSPITVSNLPKELEYLLYNANGSGSSITDLAAKLFLDAVHYGKSHAYVDFPKNTLSNVSYIEFMESGLRPYIVVVSPENVIGWRVEYDNGIEVLKNVRISEVAYDEDFDFNEFQVRQVRLVEPDLITIYKAYEDKYDIADAYENTLGKIPLLTAYANKKAPLVAYPLFEDLAHLNINHFQSLSDQINILHFCRLPLLVASGFDDDADNLEISANTLIVTNNDNANLRYVEINGQSVASGRQLNQDLENFAAKAGAEILYTKSVARQTAEGRRTDQSEALSTIQLVVRNIEQMVENAIKIAGEWIGVDASDVSVSIGSDLTLKDDPNPVNALQLLQDMFGFNNEQMLEIAKIKGLVPSHIGAGTEPVNRQQLNPQPQNNEQSDNEDGQIEQV